MQQQQEEHTLVRRGQVNNTNTHSSKEKYAAYVYFSPAVFFAA